MPNYLSGEKSERKEPVLPADCKSVGQPRKLGSGSTPTSLLQNPD